MKAKLIFFTVCILLVGYIMAQSNVQIIDILVSPVMEVDTITNLPVDSESERLAVMCKINDVSITETVQILVGTTEENGDILSISADIVFEGGLYYLSYNGESYEIADNVLTANIELSQTQAEAYNYISLYVVDESNQESNHLVFTK